ncbi:hypothetical protein WDZ92_46130, partial [Nostoc sp. NIES-2111]
MTEHEEVESTAEVRIVVNYRMRYHYLGEDEVTDRSGQRVVVDRWASRCRTCGAPIFASMPAGQVVVSRFPHGCREHTPRALRKAEREAKKTRVGGERCRAGRGHRAAISPPRSC